MTDRKEFPGDDAMTQPRRRFRGWYVVAVGAFILSIASVTLADFGGGNASSVRLQALNLIGSHMPAILLLPFIGRAVDHWGPRRAALSGLLIIGGGFVLHLGAHVVGILVLGNAVMTFGYKVAAELPMRVMVSNWFARRRAGALAFMEMPSIVGFAANTALGVGAGFAELVTSDASLLITGAFFLVLAWPISRLVRDRPEDYGLHPDGRDPALSSGDGSPASDYEWREALTSRPFWLLAAGGCAMAFAGAWGFYIAGMSIERDIPIRHTAWMSLLASYLAIPLTLVGGYLCDRLPIRRVMFGCAVVLVCAMVFTAFAYTLPVLLVSATLFGIGSGALTILPLAAVATYFGRRNLGTVLGCYLCIVNLAGFFSYAAIALVLAVFDSSTVMFLLLGLLSLAGALAYLLMREPRTVPVATLGYRAGEPTF